MFTVTSLLGGGTLVEGADITGREGRTILVSARWDTVKAVRAHNEAQLVFDAAVEEFFQPVVAAAEAAQAIAHPDKTDWSRVVLSEGKDGAEPEVVDLDMDGILLRLLEETDGSQLRWVGDDVLVAVQP